MADALLSIAHLAKAYGALKVTDDLSLDIPEGELHAIIGPNGAGKTTLIRQLAGSIPSDAGRIVFAGRDITRTSVPARVRLGLARSFQITSILAGFTVLENVALAVQARSGSSFRFWGRVADEAALNGPAMAALADVGLAHRARTRASLLSHGEKRQLEIALALATGPRLLLLDEPLAGVGREESAALVALLAALRGRLTIVLVEHDMDAVFQLAERISVLVYGRVVATGTAAQIRDNAEVRTAYLGEEASLCCWLSRAARRSTATARSSTASASRSTPARSWRCSAATAWARRRRSARCSASCRRSAGASYSTAST